MMLPVFPRPRLRAAGALLCAALSGCRQPSVPSAVVPVSVQANSRTTPARTFSTSHVQALPLYHQAQQACSRKQYRQAAALLARLSVASGLSPQERAFCREQQAICLRDAGLPVSKGTGNRKQKEMRNAE